MRTESSSYAVLTGRNLTWRDVTANRSPIRRRRLSATSRLHCLQCKEFNETTTRWCSTQCREQWEDAILIAAKLPHASAETKAEAEHIEEREERILSRGANPDSPPSSKRSADYVKNRQWMRAYRLREEQKSPPVTQPSVFGGDESIRTFLKDTLAAQKLICTQAIKSGSTTAEKVKERYGIDIYCDSAGEYRVRGVDHVVFEAFCRHACTHTTYTRGHE